MPGPLRQFAQGGTVLVVVAAPAEAAAVRLGLGAPQGAGGVDKWKWRAEPLVPGVDLLETGVGKVNAGAGVAVAVDPARHVAVVNVGICGTLLPVERLPIGSVVLADRSLYADEGVGSPTGFQSIPELGFPLGPFEGLAVPGDARLLGALKPVATMVGGIATVSTCSGCDTAAAEIARRTEAVAEAMEGAAAAHVLGRLHPGLPFAEIRVVSNTTGERSLQRWDLRGALQRLAELVGEMLTL